MSELSVEQVLEELKRGIDFYAAFDAQIFAFLGRLAEVLEEEHELAPLRKPFAKNARRASVVQTYLLVLKPTDAEVDGEEDDDEDEDDARTTSVVPLGSIQTEEDIEQLARQVAALITGE